MLARATCVNVDRWGGESPWNDGPSEVAYFPDYPPFYALYQGWFANDKQYRTFAALVFAHRNREHPYAEAVRAHNPHLSDQQIVALQKGWSPFAWYDGPVGLESARVPPPAPPFAWLTDLGAYLLGVLIIGGYFCLLCLLARYSPYAAGVVFLATPFVCLLLGGSQQQQEQQNALREPGQTDGPG